MAEKRKPNLPEVEIFTDGSCLGNPGPGGWCAILRFGSTEKVLTGGEEWTTNNRMELTAPLCALQSLNRPCSVRLTSDSRYLIEGMKSWVEGWRARGWKRARNKKVENDDLWKALVAASESHTIDWCWIRGHAGHPDNERADRLARGEIKRR
ncbi:MAG: ribonuclease HI [Planctomycetota bacterium]|jgi:ribonuclease HI